MLKKVIGRLVPEEWLISALFAVKMVLVYTGWTFFRLATESVPIITAYWKKLSDLVAQLEVSISVSMLRLFLDEKITVYPRNILLDNSKPVYVADHCLGLSAMFIFSAFVLVIEGNTKHKLWFIPLGIFLIAVINATRVAALCYIFKYAPEWFEFNHSYVYVALTYGAIFLMLMWWMERFYPSENSVN
jgi:exosortase/archaeosortase family protein